MRHRYWPGVSMTLAKDYFDPVAVATLALVAVTAILGLATFWLARVSRRSLATSVRPLLVDPGRRDQTEDEDILFGAPGRITATVRRGELFSQRHDAGNFHLSVAFHNIGPGAAAVVRAYTQPEFPGDVYVSRRFVPSDELVRINISVLAGSPETERFNDEWWAIDGVAVTVEYTDADGEQLMSSTAHIRQYATQGPFIQTLALARRRGSRWVAMAAGRGSY